MNVVNRSTVKKLHSFPFMLNNTNLMKKGGALQVTNSKEFVLDRKFYFTKALLEAFMKPQRKS